MTTPIKFSVIFGPWMFTVFCGQEQRLYDENIKHLTTPNKDGKTFTVRPSTEELTLSRLKPKNDFPELTVKKYVKSSPPHHCETHPMPPQQWDELDHITTDKEA